MTKILSSLTLFCSISLIACGSDPILDRAAEMEKENSTGKTKTDSAKTSQKKEPSQKKITPGKPKEPKPVQEKPKPQPQKQEAEKITISGNISIQGAGDWKDKPIRIDIFDGDQRSLDGPRPKVISTKRVSQMGDFSISVDKKEEKIWIGAYCDVDGDGRPGPKDPSGWYANNPVESGSDLSEIAIILEIPKEEPNPEEANPEEPDSKEKQ